MEVKARIPGQIVRISVAQGDQVSKKQILAVMEAMKMEQPVPCPADGTITQVLVAAGDKVKSGQVLFTLE